MSLLPEIINNLPSTILEQEMSRIEDKLLDLNTKRNLIAAELGRRALSEQQLPFGA